MMVEAELHLYSVVILKLASQPGAASLPVEGYWHSITHLPTTPVFPSELPLPVAGYVDGWIPVGPITIED